MPSLTGSFLVARPILQDPNFRQTVVLILQHGPEGAFGLVVNRPAEVEGVPFPIFEGGPCPADGLLMLHGHPEWLDTDAEKSPRKVAPGIFVGDAACLERVSEDSSDEELRFRICKGYAGWGPDQLEGELVSGAWAIVPATGTILFDTPVEELWDSVMPSSIPQPSLN